MNTRVALLITFAFLASVAGGADAYSMASVNSLLASYSVPNAIAMHLHPVNVTYGSGSYVLLYSAGNTLEFVVNVTSGYSIVTNQSSIAAVISNETLAMSYAQANFSRLESQMHKFESSSSGPITDCLVEAGYYHTNNTCTLDNYCRSCATVPVCSKALAALGGPDSAFGFGLMNFYTNYTQLSDAYMGFNATVSSINKTNIGQLVPQLNNSISRISQITSTIGKNPIFPPPQLTPSQVNTCIGYGSNLLSAPWYCASVGFCESLTFNNTALSNVQSTLSSMLSLPFTSAQINQVAAGAASNADLYVTPIVTRQKGEQLAIMLNTTLRGYNSTVSSVNALLSHISNASLSARLSAFESNYSHLVSDYASLNMTEQNRSMASQKSALLASYLQLNASYGSAVNTARNNTALLIALQLEGNNNQRIAALAFDQLQLSAQLNGRVSNISQSDVKLAQLHQQLVAAAGSSVDSADVLHQLSASIATAILPAFREQYSQSVSIAPLAGSLPNIIVGLVVLAFAVIMYLRAGGRQHKQTNLASRKHNHKAINRNIYLLVAILALAFIIGSYAYASLANSSAPFGSFTAAVASSNTIVIALNGTSTQGMLSCAAKVSSQASSLNKTVQSITILGDRCSSASGIEATGACLAAYASRNVPVIILSNGNTTSIHLYSYYGTVLSVRGNSSSMASCPAALLVG